MREKTPLITVIICTFNTKVLTLKCLKNLKKSVDYINRPVEVVLVENGSDGTAKEVKKKYKWIKIIEPGENTGFARGNNMGIEASNKKSQYYLLLNTDAFVEKNTLSESVKFMKEHQDCGLLGCKLLFEDNKFQPSAGFLPTPWSVVTWSLGLDLIPGLNRLLKPFHPNYKDFFANDRKVGWVTGAYWFFRNSVIRKTKGFDEKYFMYGEEIEWCKRISDAGFYIWYTPNFEIIHLFARSSESTRNAFLREIEGLYYFIDKYYPGKLYLIKQVVKLGMLARAVAFFMIGNNFRSKIHLEAVNI